MAVQPKSTDRLLVSQDHDVGSGLGTWGSW